MVKRGKLEIMRDILKLVQENKNPIKSTPLLRKSNMSSESFKKYYADLLEKKLIIETIEKSGVKYITLSERGMKFLERYKTIVEFIDEFEL